jgi:hypothetical protein
VRQDRAGHVHGSEDVHLELLQHLLPRRALEDAGEAEAGVVDQHVEPAEARDACSDGLGDAASILDVEPGDEAAGKILGSAHGGDDVPAIPGEEQGGVAAEAFGAAGDEDGLGHAALVAPADC